LDRQQPAGTAARAAADGEGLQRLGPEDRRRQGLALQLQIRQAVAKRVIFRAPERSVLKVGEHWSAENRSLQPGITKSATVVVGWTAEADEPDRQASIGACRRGSDCITRPSSKNMGEGKSENIGGESAFG